MNAQELMPAAEPNADQPKAPESKAGIIDRAVISVVDRPTQGLVAQAVAISRKFA